VGCGGWSRRKTLYGGDDAKTQEEADDVADPATEPARIRAFFVHPDWTRQGIGRALLEISEQAARRAGFHRLELAAVYTGVPLYAACGYQAVEPLEATMPDGNVFSGIRMKKTLD
jgi:GNAT superfamily N-acetyltransferase